MAENINVFLITGFLGSGKTTFLNRLIGQFPRDRKLMILMNEFGEIGIDGTLVSLEDLDVLEISKGSIFCACVKTDFIKGLFEIAKKIRPEILLIESTGVANPIDLKKDLELPIFQDSFKLKEQFCMLDAENFLGQFGVFASVENQISSSSRFIINKVDLATREQVEEIKSLVSNYHPSPVFYETTFADIDVAHLLSLDQNRYNKDKGYEDITEEELDRYAEELLSQPGASVTPPDILMSATFWWKEASLSAIRQLSARLPREVLRAKGFLWADKKIWLYSYVMGRFSIEERQLPVKEDQKNVLVLIFDPDALPEVERVMGEFSLAKTGELVPGEGVAQKLAAGGSGEIGVRVVR